jgi:putative ABC transport system ATP-binding protein
LLSDASTACHGLVKIYWTATGEVHALKGVDAVFPQGTVTAVVGPSGSGKSSLLRILAGLDRPTAGSVTIGGRELVAMSRSKLRKMRRRLVGYVFQRPSENLIPYLTVMEHLRVAAELRGPWKPREAMELLELLGLGHRRHHRPAQLSGGEQQRAAFAQAVVGGPALVVADEPTAELDSRSGSALLETISQLTRTGVGFVVSTHDPHLVVAADRTLQLRHGAVEAETWEAKLLSVIDQSGRIQLPPQALKLFPDRRAELVVDNGVVRITPP